MNLQGSKILASNETLLELLGAPRHPIGPFRASCFNYCVSAPGGGILVYNTLSNSLAHVVAPFSGLFEHCEGSATEQGDIPEDFFRLRFLVPADENELDTYRHFHELLLALRNLQTGVVRYNIYTTTACNARCFYCFEEGLFRETMDTETARAVARYILKTHSPSDEIHFRWFGGEPLLNPNAITLICETCQKQHVRFYSTLSTNGWLLDAKMIRLALDKWNLAKVRFSFDGTREMHNLRKAFLPKGDGFLRTLDNLRCAVHAGVHVVIRFTMDLENVGAIRDLACDLVEEFRERPNVVMYAKCIGQELSRKAYETNPERVIRTLEAQENLNEWLHAKGKFDPERIKPAGLRIHNCGANDPRKIVVSPAGKLSSCECYCIPEYQWGDVWSGIVRPDIRHQWTNPSGISEKCGNCALLPVCTPFAHDCPWDLFDCRTRFKPTMRLFMLENYRRYLHGIPLLPDTEDFSVFRFLNVEETNQAGKEVE